MRAEEPKHDIAIEYSGQSVQANHPSEGIKRIIEYTFWWYVLNGIPGFFALNMKHSLFSPGQTHS